MISTIDKGDSWFWSDGEMLYGEDGTRRPVMTSDIIFTAGKFAGTKLSDVTDSGYMKFIMTKNPDDYFIIKMFTLRLGELKI